MISLYRYIKEVKRKSLHLSSLWIPCIYYFIDKQPMLILLGVVAAGVVITDIGRHYSRYLQNLFYTLFGDILRPHELQSDRIALTGASYVMLGSLIVIMLFHKLIAITALVVLMVSDSCAALIGKRYGTKLLVGEKSLQGTLGFILSGWGVVFIVGSLYPVGKSYYITAAAAVCIGALVELFSKKLHIDENLTIPLSIGSFMWAVWYVMEKMSG